MSDTNPTHKCENPNTCIICMAMRRGFSESEGEKLARVLPENDPNWRCEKRNCVSFGLSYRDHGEQHVEGFIPDPFDFYRI